MKGGGVNARAPDGGRSASADDRPAWYEVADALWLACRQAAAARTVKRATIAPAPEQAREVKPEPTPHTAYTASVTAEPDARARRPTIQPVVTDLTTDRRRRDADGGAGPWSRGDGAEPTTAAPEPALRTYPRRSSSPSLVIALGGDLFEGVPPLRNRRRLAHALRPFKRSVDVRAGAGELDEEATARRAAQDGLWLPQCRAAQERWLDLDVVVDDSRFAHLHRPMADRFIDGIATVGAFRRIQIHLLDTDLGEPGSLTLRGTGAIAPRVPAAGLATVGKRDRRIVLVLTDGVGDAWHSAAAHQVLGEWARRFPVAIVQMLPGRQWRRTGIAAHAASLRTSSPAIANLHYRARFADLELSSPKVAPIDGRYVPVLEMDHRHLADWARFVTADEHGWYGAVAVCGADSADPSSPWHSGHATGIEEDEPVCAPELVRRFRAAVPPTVFALAVHLAAAPLNIPVMRLVQRTMLPDSRPADLSELVGSGLLRRVGPVDERDTEAAHQVTYDFFPGIRAELLAAARRSETTQVLMTVAEHLGERVGVLRELRDMVMAPHQAEVPALTADVVAFAEPVLYALQALAGPYTRPAQRLRASLQSTVRRAPDDAEITQRNHRPDSGKHSTEPAPGINDSMRTVNEQTLIDSRVAEHPGDPKKIASSGVSVTIRGIPPAAERDPAAPPPVWGNVPPRNINFTGREELLTILHERLSQGTTAVLPEALHGMGGVGKSQIAIEYVYRHTQNYDLIWWISAERPGQIKQALADLAAQLGLPISSEVNVAVPAVREALRIGRPYRNWLLVFDNAEELDEVRDFFPTNGPGKILVTSRNHAWTSVANSLEVDIFAREESLALLRLRGPELDEPDANELAQLLGDLPLAIEQAAVWLSETGMPVTEYLELFRRNHEKAAELLHDAAPIDYELPVAAAWNVSLERLRTSDPGALRLLQVCAFFAPEPISRRLLTGSRNIDGPPELLEALSDPIKLGRAIRAINQYALAKINHRDNTIMLHRLVQRVLIGQMAPQEAAELRHCGHQLLAQADPNAPDQSVHWKQYAQMLPHVLHSRVVDCDDAWARQLLLNQIEFLFRWGDHRGFLSLSQRAVDSWTDALGAEHEQTLAAGLHLGRALRLNGRFHEAYDHHVHVRDTLTRNCGPEDERTLEAQQFVGADLRYLGDFAAALALDKRSLEILQRRFGPDDPTTLRQAHLYAVDLRLTGRPGQALELDLDNHRRLTTLLGDDHPSTLSSLVAIAVDEMENGHYLQARNRMEDYIHRVERVYEPGTPALAEGLNLLSVMERKAGNHDRALELSTQAMPLLENRYGHMHPSSVAAALNHAINLRQTGHLTEAITLSEQTIERYKTMFGPAHHNIPVANVNLAVALRLNGQVADARHLDEAALATLTEGLGADHPRSIICSINLASDLHALGDDHAALDLDRHTFERAQRVLGRNHPTTLACALNYALDLRATGLETQAEKQLADTLIRLRKLLGDNHSATISARQGTRADCDIFPIPV